MLQLLTRQNMYFTKGARPTFKKVKRVKNMVSRQGIFHGLYLIFNPTK